MEVLPRNAADAPAYNHLKEMVVVHTGLELGATIYLDYTVTSKPGYLPEVDIFEELLQSSPVKEYTLTIVIPEAKELAYTLTNNPAKASVKRSGGTCTTSWTLRNLPASSALRSSMSRTATFLFSPPRLTHPKEKHWQPYSNSSIRPAIHNSRLWLRA